MINTLKQKSAKYIEWNVEVPRLGGPHKVTAETFFYQGGKCTLEFYSGHPLSLSSDDARLSFKNSGKLLLPVAITIRILRDSECLVEHLNYSITSTNQTIWRHITALSSCLLTFELMFHADDSKEDRCIQTASYMHNDISIGSLPGDFSKLLETGSDHDVEIKCGEDTMKTHKFVLSARSSVFKAMLQSNMLEGQTGIMEIKDMDASYFKEFIRYLYADIMPELTFDKAKALYKVGDKYDVRNLMLLCADYLQDTLSPENAFECYVLADAHADQKLKDIIKTYLLEEKIYLQKEHWLPFYKSFPEIALEVYRLSYEKDVEK